MTTTQSATQGIDPEQILETDDVSVHFDMSRGHSKVVDTVSLGVERNEILGVVGESGSGKSMFASALLDAVVDPGEVTGEITYNPADDEPIPVLELTSEELRRYRWEEVSMVFQGAMSAFNPVQKIRTHFKETLDAHNTNRKKGIERAKGILSDLYLEPDRVLDSYPHELSGGMKQRALIALSLVLEPSVLVLDEPTASLDLLMQRSIIALLDDLKQQYDLTLVFITHDLPLVRGLCDRLAVMYAFEFVEIGPTQRLIDNPRHPYTRSLLNATPNINTSTEEMRPIEGSAPDPINVPSGCSYHPRCPLADEVCQTDDPGLLDVEDGHTAACHYWEDSADAIPLSLETVGETDTPPSSAADRGSRESRAVSGGEQPVVSLENVSVHFEEGSSIFGSSDIVHAVDDVTLDIYENDVVVLVGESGCGKTTLGKTAIGLQQPTDGSVRYRGQDIWDARHGRGDVSIHFEEIRRSLQIIHQDPGSSLNPQMTVLASLEEPLRRWQSDLTAAGRRDRIHQMLERVDMTPATDYSNRYPHQLSGGEKQRVALVRALLMNPDLILADEAVSALDVSLRVEMMDLLLELQDVFNTSFLFVSHNLSNARYLAEKTGGRIGVMYLGKLVEVGTADEILYSSKHPYTEVLKWSTPSLVPDEEKAETAPVRSIDVPDAVNPPSGCRFHTRCPEAREICTEQTPQLESGSGGQPAACFRQFEDHDYWASRELGAGSADD